MYMGFNTEELHESYTLSPKQLRHVTLVLKIVPRLQTLRHDLVPLHMTEDTFWRVYFELIQKKLEGAATK